MNGDAELDMPEGDIELPPEFMDAAENVKQLDRAAIRERAVSLYNLDTIGLQYEAYFNRLLTLWGDGWYEMGDANG